jgi:hypothetical protein
VTQNDLSVTGVIMVLCTIGILEVLTSYLGFRFRRIRPYLQGEPIVLVENGKLIERNMRRERLTLDDLAEMGPAERDRLHRRHQMGRAGNQRRYQLHQTANQLTLLGNLSICKDSRCRLSPSVRSGSAGEGGCKTVLATARRLPVPGSTSRNSFNTYRAKTHSPHLPADHASVPTARARTSPCALTLCGPHDST